MPTAQQQTADDFAAQSRQSLAQSRDYLAAGRLHKASASGWQAASLMGKAVAAAQGWDYEYNDNDMFNSQFGRVVRRASRLAGNRRLGELSGVGIYLRDNHYRRKRHLCAQIIAEDIGLVAEVVELLAPLTAPPEGGDSRLADFGG